MGTQDQPLEPAGVSPTGLEFEEQRQRSARLLDDLATAIAKSASGCARRTGHAAQYVQEHYVKDAAGKVARFIRLHPAGSLAGAVVVGYAAGCLFRKR